MYKRKYHLIIAGFDRFQTLLDSFLKMDWFELYLLIRESGIRPLVYSIPNVFKETILISDITIGH